MTSLATVVTLCGELRPSVFDADQITAWINEIEARIVEEVINRAQGNDVTFEELDYNTDAEEELYATPNVYTSYVFAKEDYILGDITRYNNDAAMHEAEFSEFAKRYRRENYPK